MKKKFETNVASEIPKTRLQEPGLPWKLSSDDLDEIESKDEEYKAVIAGMPPLRTRSIFLIMLVLAIFAATLYVISRAIIENENIRNGMLKREKEIATLQATLEKVTNEKNSLNQTSSQLEKRVSDLTAQKELFTTVIESLTKKGDDIENDKKEEQKTLTGQTP